MQTSILRPVCVWCFRLCSVLLLTLMLPAALPVRAAEVRPVLFGTLRFDSRDFEKPFTKIAAGASHTIALRTDGKVVAWGWNGLGEATVRANLSGVTEIAAGVQYSIALKSDGTVVTWGDNPAVYVELSGVTAIAAGAYHAVALKNDGTVVAWGKNETGQTTVPVGLSGVVAVAAGGRHTVALKSDGMVVAWGDNSSGQTTIPSGLNRVVAVTAGESHTAALRRDGTVVVWGDNTEGQATVPTEANEIVAISAGAAHTVALKNDGTVMAWGRNTKGQSTVPAGLSAVTAIAAGWSHTVALKKDGRVVAWGDNEQCQATTPDTFDGVVALEPGGDYNIVALRKDGTVMALGNDRNGQTSVTSELSEVKAIDAGARHAVALKNDGTVAAWGTNDFGQTSVPAGLSGVTAIAAGRHHTAALKSDGTVVVWGDNRFGQASVPVGLSGVTAIAAGANHTVGLKSDGTVVAWGVNNDGQRTVPLGLSGVVAIAAGSDHTVALKSDGTIVAWGANDYGQRAVPAGLGEVVAVAAGRIHTAVLKKDGTVFAWGYQGSGQTFVPSGLSGVTAIAAGGDQTTALFAVPDEPIVTTGIASDIGATAVALTGTVLSYNTPAEVSFEYGKTTTYGTAITASPALVSGGAGTLVRATLSGLLPRTTYYYRVVATSAQGVAHGEQGTFTTLNTMPMVGADAVSASGGRTTAVDVLANDGDEEGDSLTITEVTPSRQGMVAVRDGRIFYTPNPGFSGEDTFTYTVSDGFGGTAKGTVTVTVPERPQDPVVTLLSAKGEPVPGAGVENSETEDLPKGSTWATFGVPAINDASQIAFAATVRAGKATHGGIFTYDATEERYALVAKNGDAVPELQGPVFATLKDPVLDQAGRVAFLATLSGPGTTKTSNEGVFTTAYGDLQLLARKGDQPPDAPTGAKWTEFLSLALPDGVAGPLFVAKMAGARSTGISAANDVGLWGADSNGNVRLLLREGQEVNGKKLKSFVALSTVPSVSGQTRSFNEAGEVVVRAHFTDGSQGLVTVQVP